MNYFVQKCTRIQKTDQNLKMQVYNINIRKLHFQANLCEVFAEDKKQQYWWRFSFRMGRFAGHAA